VFRDVRAASCGCPQAYAYANGNPLKYVDPDGRVVFDASWAGAPRDHFMRGLEAVRELKKSKRCKCIFDNLWGRYPINDAVPLGYRTQIDGGGALGYSEGGAMLDLRSDFDPGIYVSAGVFAGTGTGVAQGRIAHELTHYVFGAVHSIDPTKRWGKFPECPGLYCNPSFVSDSAFQADPEVPDAVKKCASCD
jgi:hypothetical protein